MSEAIVLSAKDQLKLDVVAKIEAKVMDRDTAQEVLDVCARTLRRYIKSYRESGLKFVMHGNRGRRPKNKADDELKNKVMKLMKERYYDFNMLHALEKINEDLDLELKRERFRRWCHDAGLVKHHTKRRSKPRMQRTRMKRAGLLIQMDGSHHKWFGGMESCLIAAIDDATGEVVFAEFFHGETTLACLKVLRGLVSTKGIFEILYVDKAGVFGGVKRTGFSQVERALGELGTQVIYAHSPQAKGRVERLFKTLQDRLIPEMRLAQVKSLRSANKFLQQVFLPTQFNPRFSHRAESPISAYRPLPEALDLEQVFCIKEYRKVSNDHTISFRGVRYMINQRLEYSIANQRLEIQIHEKGRWRAYYGGQKLGLVRIQEIKKLAA